jgi:hypothetical protein
MNNKKDRQLFDTIEKITQLDRKDRIFLWQYLKSMRGKADGIIGDIPSNVKVNGTSAEFFKSLNDAFYAGTISLNDMFQGQVRMSDLPNEIGNAEVTIQVIEGIGGIPIFNVTLTTTKTKDDYSPFRWDYSSREGEFTQWYARAIGNGGSGAGADETIYIDNSDESKAKNLEVTAKYSTTQSIPVIVTDNNGLKCIGNYFNGIITFVVDGALKIEDVSFETGETSSFASVDIDRLEEYTHLEIGDSTEVKSFNLEQLLTGTQLVSIDYGYGVATWNSTSGGTATINIASGHIVMYSIGADGTVTKTDEIENVILPETGKKGQYLVKKVDDGNDLEYKDIPVAAADTAGVVKIGSGINVADDGTISVDLNFLDQVSYGIEWDTTVADSACTRIGNMSMHRTLPIQSAFKGCVAKGKNIQYYLDPNDWSKKVDGSASVLDGTDGDVRVDTGNKWYYKGFEDGTKRQFRMSLTKVDDTWIEVPRLLVSAWGITLDRTTADTPKACVVMNTTANFRGGNNSDTLDTYITTLPCRSNLGKPATTVSRIDMRTYIANAANDQEILCYDFYKALVWCYYVEYANFNCQLPFNAELTSEGYHQGGLGNGLTTFTQSNAWSNFNSYNPITPCGYLNDIGNFSGVKNISIPTIVIDGTTTINPITLTSCKYRGIENLFGDYWKNLEGIVLQKPDADSANVIYATSDNTKFDDEISNKEIRGVESKENGYVKTFLFGDRAEIIAATVGGSSITYKADCHYTNADTNEKTLFTGGSALDGDFAGFGSSYSSGGIGFASTSCGFFSCIRLD